jgi:hypothetical protein
VPHVYTETLEKEHGHRERRRYRLTGRLEWVRGKGEWHSLTSVGMVESTRELNGGSPCEVLPSKGPRAAPKS